MAACEERAEASGSDPIPDAAGQWPEPGVAQEEQEASAEDGVAHTTLVKFLRPKN